MKSHIKVFAAAVLGFLSFTTLVNAAALDLGAEYRVRGISTDNQEDLPSRDQQRHHGSEHSNGNYLNAHSIVFPRKTRAMSLMKKAIPCRSISMAPIGITIVIGQRMGRQ